MSSRYDRAYRARPVQNGNGRTFLRNRTLRAKCRRTSPQKGWGLGFDKFGRRHVQYRSECPRIDHDSSGELEYNLVFDLGSYGKRNQSWRIGSSSAGSRWASIPNRASLDELARSVDIVDRTRKQMSGLAVGTCCFEPSESDL